MQKYKNDSPQKTSFEKRSYVFPILKRYEAPKLEKHQSYKEITLAPGSLVYPTPTPGPPGGPPPGSATLPDDMFPG